MTHEEAIKQLTNVVIYHQGECTREALDMAIEALEKQIPKKPYKDNENGVYEKDYCPTCNRSLFPIDHHCVCGQAIDWGESE